MSDRRQWSRRQLKERGRAVLKIHYWRIVLVALILTMLIGSDGILSTVAQSAVELERRNQEREMQEMREVQDAGTGAGYGSMDRMQEGGELLMLSLLFIMLLLILVMAIAVPAALLLVAAFVLNPIYVGTMRFFLRSFDRIPKFKDVFYAFDNRYKNVVSIMFLRDLYTFLWCLLLLVPGVVKAYEYKMVPYLLAENPHMEAKEAFAVSRTMMHGQKWKAFLLDLSFLGWHFLSLLTFGLLAVFYVTPYSYLTRAALYRRLRGRDEPRRNIYYEGMPAVEETSYGKHIQ